jgi:hypothetical protein
VTPSRSKLLDVLLALALVVLSAVGLRLSDPEEKTFQVVNGVIGKPVKINNGDVIVTRVRVGTVVKQYGEIQDSTAGMFVAVSVTGAATGPKPLRLDAQLLSKQVRYRSYSFTSVAVNPGFEISTDAIFEVDPAHMDNLTLEMWPGEVLSAYQEHARIKLGITAANADQWVAAARGQELEMVPDARRAIP